MNMFSRSFASANGESLAVSSFQYRSTDISTLEEALAEEIEELGEPEVRLTEKSLRERLAAEREAGSLAAEAALRSDFEHKIQLNTKKTLKVIADFEKAQKEYFSRVEAEVVQLALAISGKILHREAQVDPMLLSAIVHLALGQLKEGSAVSIRVRPEQAPKWREQMLFSTTNLEVRVVEDCDLQPDDCVLDTELGSVNFSLDAQLKEVERGFLDVLAQKPQV